MQAAMARTLRAVIRVAVVVLLSLSLLEEEGEACSTWGVCGIAVSVVDEVVDDAAEELDPEEVQLMHVLQGGGQ